MSPKQARIAVALLALAVLSTVPVPAAADNVTVECALDRPRDEVEIGDGPWIGDAPDARSVFLTRGCWNGEAAGSDDRDSFHLSAGVGNILIEVRVLEGCVDVAGYSTGEPFYDPTDLREAAGMRHCAGYRDLLMATTSDVEIVFSNGTAPDDGAAVYTVAY